MSDTDTKAEEDRSQNRDDAQDDGGDDEVREGPFPLLPLHRPYFVSAGQEGVRLKKNGR